MSGNGFREAVLGRMIQQTIPQPYAIASDEDRCAKRYEVSIHAILRPSCEAGFKVIVNDLSMAGFGCNGVTHMRPGARCWLTLPGLAGLQAEIVWNNGSVVGGAFSDMLNEAVLANIARRYARG